MYYRFSRRSVVVLAASWAIFVFVIVNIYSSCWALYTSLTYKLIEIETLEKIWLISLNTVYQPLKDPFMRFQFC